MNIKTNDETVDEIKKILQEHTDQPANVRIYVAGMACSGPSFGLALDEKNDSDLEYLSDGLNFIMDREVYEQFGDIIVEFTGGGYLVKPVNQPESACSSCSGSCS